MRRLTSIQPPNALAVSLLLAFVVTTVAIADGGPAPQLVVLADSLFATEGLAWSVPFEIRNPTAYGIYADSLECEVESLDPGETRESRRFRMLLPGASTLISSLSGNTAAPFQYEMRATAEHARLTFRLYTHQSTGPLAPLVAHAEVWPGPTSAAYPSQFIRVDGRAVEYLLVPAADSAAAAGLLLIHDHGSNARLMLARAIQLSRRGYAVMAVSMPGYGLSTGPADFGGPATLKAMGAALDVLEKTRGVDKQRIAVWGISRGAGVAALLAAQRADLRCAIAQSGIYDLWAVQRGTTSAGFRDSIVAEAGRDSAAWRARSAALVPAKARTPLLILHGDRDVRVPAAQARGYFAALKAAGVAVESRFASEGEHVLTLQAVDRPALEFLARQLKR